MQVPKILTLSADFQVQRKKLLTISHGFDLDFRSRTRSLILNKIENLRKLKYFTQSTQYAAAFTVIYSVNHSASLLASLFSQQSLAEVI